MVSNTLTYAALLIIANSVHESCDSSWQIPLINGMQDINLDMQGGMF